MTAPPLVFDRTLRQKRLSRAARSIEAAEFLRLRVVDDLLDRIELVDRRFDSVLDLGARRGLFARRAAASPLADRIGAVIETDSALPMLRGRDSIGVVADEERLPFAPASFDLVVSALALHWVNDLVGALIQIRQALRPDGLMLCAMLGGATLVELRRSFMEADLRMSAGAGPRVSPFIDASDAGDLLRRSGFAMPVVDVDRVVVRYDHPLRLMADLRAMGETNALFERARAPLSRATLAKACEVYVDTFAGADGRVTASFEIITLTGWAPHPLQPKPAPRGSGQTRLAAALGEIRQRRDAQPE
jgi:SAM-dependent methyltransferase